MKLSPLTLGIIGIGAYLLLKKKAVATPAGVAAGEPAPGILTASYVPGESNYDPSADCNPNLSGWCCAKYGGTWSNGLCYIDDSGL